MVVAAFAARVAVMVMVMVLAAAAAAIATTCWYKVSVLLQNPCSYAAMHDHTVITENALTVQEYQKQDHNAP